MTARRILLILLIVGLTATGAAAQKSGTLPTEIRCDFPGEMIEAGDTAVFDLSVTNRGIPGPVISTTGLTGAPTAGRSGSWTITTARSTGC